jgi:uncharacterized protein (DUF305 family)
MRVPPTSSIAFAITLFAASAAGAQATPVPAPNAADVRFMQGMIQHHAQAIEMVALIGARTTNPVLKSLGERIDVSQKDEIGMMRRWLKEHGAAADGSDHADMQMEGHEMLMPGMLTARQMAALAKAKGAAFDRLFLTGMIQHHQGAIRMVKDLFATTGAAQATDIFRFASDVDADQRAEIARMQALLPGPRKK